jgi:chromosome segregation ATPase
MDAMDIAEAAAKEAELLKDQLGEVTTELAETKKALVVAAAVEKQFEQVKAALEEKERALSKAESVHEQLQEVSTELRQKDEAISIMDNTATMAIQKVAELEGKIRAMDVQQIEQLRETASVQAENTRLLSEHIANKQAVATQEEMLRHEIEELKRRLRDRNTVSVSTTLDHC